MPHDRAGQPAELGDLIDIAHLVTAYYTTWPDLEDPGQRVAFGTSGHRGSSLDGSFTEAHIIATTQAICDYRSAQGISGPLFLAGTPTGCPSRPGPRHWRCSPATRSLTLIDSRNGYTPTPALSHAILSYNRGRPDSDAGRGDGIVVTPSHNPPSDGGFKYNPPHGGPADTDATGWIAERANELLAASLREVKRVPAARAHAADTTGTFDFLGAYVDDLPEVLDLAAIASAGVRIGADPLGGAAVHYWGEIADRHGLDLTVVNPRVDATWRFMTLDWDGKIRMDCSSPFAMASLIAQRHAFQISTGNDADADRHGIVTPDAGLMNPNHFLAVAIAYLFENRSDWPEETAIGKTLVSSSMIDRVAEGIGRRLLEVPVGFKWFVPGLLDGSVGFGGEESAGASFLRRDGARLDHGQGRHPAGTAGGGDPRRHRQVAQRALRRTDGQVRGARVCPDRRACRPGAEGGAGEALTGPGDGDRAGRRADPSKLTTAPGNGASIGGLKVVTESAWFAARPSGTEDVYKIYAESFKGAEHLAEVQDAARELVSQALASAAPAVTISGTVAAEPEPVTAEPEPVAAEPEPVTAEPEPVTVDPEPVAAEAEPDPVAAEPKTEAEPAASAAKAEPEAGPDSADKAS